MTKLSKQISALILLLPLVLPYSRLCAQGAPQHSVTFKVQIGNHTDSMRRKEIMKDTFIEYSGAPMPVTRDMQANEDTAPALDDPLPNIVSTKNVKCGAYIAEGVWKAFKCHNLGADEQVDPFKPSMRLNGNYYQWGRSMEAAKGPGCEEEHPKPVSVWNTRISSNGSWTDAYKTSNDPCPTGFRVPTRVQWEAVINPLLNPTLQFLGPWSSYSTNYSSGVLIGSEASGLFLPAAGARDLNDGTLFDHGHRGDYWSSTENGNYAWSLRFYKGNTLTYINYRTFGFSIRCIEE